MQTQNPEEKRNEILEKYKLGSKVSASSMLKMPKLTLEDRKQLFITHDFIPFPKNSVSLIAAAGGSGKTFLSIIVACEHVLKEHRKGNSSKVLLWLSEDADYIVADRLNLVINIIRNYSDEEIEIISENIYFWTASDHFPFHFAHLHGSTLVENKEILPLFQEQIDEMGVDLLIIDPLLNFFGGEENSNSQARSFINILNRWATESQKTIILLHHAGKGEDSFARGASAFADSSRFVITLEKIKVEDPDTGKLVISDSPDDRYDRMVVIKKDNYGAPALLRAIGIDPEELRIQVLPHVFTLDEKKELEDFDKVLENVYGGVK
jgi:replicative DNA helicase